MRASKLIWVVVFMAILTGLMSSIFGKATAYCNDLPPQVLDKPDYQVIYVKVPVSKGYSIIPVVSNQLDLLPNLVDKVKEVAVAGINAGFFDPNNKLTTSYVIASGKTLANPVDNRNFVENPALYQYLPKMLNRTEFRVLQCGDKFKYDIAKRMDMIKFRCKLHHSIQAGPNLYEPGATTEEAFIATKNGTRIRDPLGVDRKNARSAIGLDNDGNVILAMVAMKPLKDLPSGVTLRELSRVMRELGATQAMALDGGSSSTFWAGGQTIYGKLDSAANPVRRPIKSALVVVKEVQ